MSRSAWCHTRPTSTGGGNREPRGHRRNGKTGQLAGEPISAGRAGPARASKLTKPKAMRLRTPNLCCPPGPLVHRPDRWKDEDLRRPLQQRYLSSPPTKRADPCSWRGTAWASSACASTPSASTPSRVPRAESHVVALDGKVDRLISGVAVVRPSDRLSTARVRSPVVMLLREHLPRGDETIVLTICSLPDHCEVALCRLTSDFAVDGTGLQSAVRARSMTGAWSTRWLMNHAAKVFGRSPVGGPSALGVVLGENLGSVPLPLGHHADVEAGVKQLA